MFDLITFDPKIILAMARCSSAIYELRFASVTAIVLMIPGAGLLLLLGRFLKSEYPVFFGQL